MGTLDYFLNKVWQSKKNKMTNNERYTALALREDGQNPHFQLETRLDADRYLFDYMKAFGSLTTREKRQEVSQLEILSMLLISKEITDRNPKSLNKTITELMHGRRPRNQEEIRIMNLIEALALIETEGFEINHENYDVIVHILFRNLGFDIENKARFYRQTDDQPWIKGILDHTKIDATLNHFLNYISKLSEKDISGFTQAWLILAAFLYISPYQQNNLLLGFVLSKWFLQASQKNGFMPNPIYGVLYDWPTFEKLLAEAFANDFDLDQWLAFLQKASINSINMIHRLITFDYWINNDPIYYHMADYLLPNLIDKMMTIQILKKVDSKNGIGLDKMINSFRLRGRKVFKDQDILDIKQRLVDQKFLVQETKNGRTKLRLKNLPLQKMQRLLADQTI